MSNLVVEQCTKLCPCPVDDASHAVEKLQSAERGAQNNGLTAAKTWRYARVKSSLLAFLPPPARDSGNRIHPKDHHSSRGVQPCLARRASSAREQQPARLSHQCHLFRLRAKCRSAHHHHLVLPNARTEQQDNFTVALKSSSAFPLFTVGGVALPFVMNALQYFQSRQSATYVLTVHTLADADKARKREQAGKDCVNPPFCYCCKKPGHRSSVCPEKKGLRLCGFGLPGQGFYSIHVPNDKEVKKTEVLGIMHILSGQASVGTIERELHHLYRDLRIWTIKQMSEGDTYLVTFPSEEMRHQIAKFKSFEFETANVKAKVTPTEMSAEADGNLNQFG